MGRNAKKNNGATLVKSREEGWAVQFHQKDTKREK